MGPVHARIVATLTEQFHPAKLDVVDESHLHAGHAGARPEGETHFRVIIEAEDFRGVSRVARHRLINEALAAELAGPVHALAIRAEAPTEAA
ncbi:BolA family transcriptional regulator [Acuticoccus sp. M5D2P5]|uniref:BolA family protein n=1 Tax=Acuticoccus kalidii TaxID=2910977 RepID=UPI001F460635|nr:BolA family protein [Acuticoccus kalidii]MCF3936280.1 BolA family transcriptional regulator [Acuticoccus kalidii]